jgi:hypothetical protein
MARAEGEGPKGETSSAGSLLTRRWREMDSNMRSSAREALLPRADVCFQGKDPEAALPSFRPRHRVRACGALDIFLLRALDVDQIAE